MDKQITLEEAEKLVGRTFRHDIGAEFTVKSVGYDLNCDLYVYGTAELPDGETIIDDYRTVSHLLSNWSDITAEPTQEDAEICECGHALSQHYSEWGHATCMECPADSKGCCEPNCDYEQPAAEWIYVEDRLPQEVVLDCLITVQLLGGNLRVFPGSWSYGVADEMHAFRRIGDSTAIPIEKVIAWMPMPEAAKPREK